MSKASRKRSKARRAAKAAAKAAEFGMAPGPRPPPPDGFCGGGPPHPVPLLGPMMTGDRFHTSPPDFGPPMMEDRPFRNEPPEFVPRDRFVHRPGFHPQELDIHQRFRHPDLVDGPRGFHPEPYGDRPLEFEGGPSGFVPPEFRDGPRGFVPPEFRDGPNDFVPPEFRDGPQGFVPPEFRDRQPGFVPPEFRDGPQGFVPPEFRDEPQGFVPPEFRERQPGFVPPEFRDRPQGFVPPETMDGQHGFDPPEFRGGQQGFDPPEFRGGQQGFDLPEFRGGPPRFAPVAGIQPSQFVDGPGYPAKIPDHGPQDLHNTASSVASCPPLTTPEATQSSTSVNNENSKSSTTTTTKKEMPVVKSLLGSVKPPPGRSLGVITFIANSYGFIEREDLKKYSFSFDAFFGKRNHLVPGVKVHFTAVKELGKECATDVKIAPQGTEEIEPTVYEGIVTTVLPDTYVLEAHPGRIRTILKTETVKLPFGKMDSKATLLLFDRVKFQLLTNIITKVRRATNVTPQMPETFQLTKEMREKGIITNINNDTCTIVSKKHENLTASLSEYLSDEQLKVMDEVDFTLVTVKEKLKAIRLKKLPEGSVEFKDKLTDTSACKSMWKPVISKEETVEDISSEKYEGTVSKTIPKGSKMETGQQLPQGLVITTEAGAQKSLPFGSGDVVTQATMMVGDKVQFNIATKQETKEERAINIVIQPETFQQESTEQRKIGIVVKLNDNSGFIKAPLDPQLFFDLSEVMDEAKLMLSEKVEFTLAMGASEGKQAIRIRRLTESVFTSVPKIEEKKEKKKMTIKLLKDPNEHIKNDNKTTEDKDCDSLAADNPAREKVEVSNASKQDNKDKQENINKGSRERSKSRESNSRSRDKSNAYYGKHRSSSRDRSYRNYRRSRSRSRDRSRRCSRSKSRERLSRSGKKRSHSPEYTDEHRRRRIDNKESSSKRRSKSPDGQNKTAKHAAISPSTEAVNNEIEKKRKELLELNELIARKKAIIAMEQTTKSQFKETLEMNDQHGIAMFDYQHKTYVDNSWTPDLKPVRSILKKYSESLSCLQHQKSERIDSPEEPVGCPETKISSAYMSVGSVPGWIKQSSKPETDDQELARKKRQLEELSESIARKRAIIAMEQKAKALSDGSEMKKKYDFVSRSDDLDITMPIKNTWQLDIKPDLQPKKSILKNRSECVTDQAQKDLTSGGQYAIFSMSKQPNSAFLSPSEPSDASFKKPCNPPSVLSNTDDLFKKLIDTSASSCKSSNNTMGQQSFQPSSNLFYDQKSSRESKDKSYSTSPCQIPQFSHQGCDQASTSEASSTESSATKRQSNLATQMERFLGALNKADSHLVSSLLRDANDSGPLESQRNPQQQAKSKVSCGGELYDPFKETDRNEDNYPLIGSRQKIIPMLGRIESTQDDLLPHERAVVDGSGFSKIVGMRYGIETKPENPFLYGESIPSTSQSRLLEEHEKFLEECDQFKQSQDHYIDEPYHNDSKYVEDRERYKRQKPSDRRRVEGGLGPVQRTSKDAHKDADQRASHYKIIQDLLQTVGLDLDTTDISNLADRTNERLYGKKVKPQSSHSSDHKDERSARRYERRDSSHSTDSEGVRSVSPAKSSNREVYMSYSDTLKHRHDEVAAGKPDLFSLKRTIRNSPEAKQTTPDPYNIAPPEVSHEAVSEAQPVGLQYTQIFSEYSSVSHHVTIKQDSQQCSYAVDGKQNPYGSVSVNPLHYASGYPTLPSQLPPGYGAYASSAGPLPMMPPSPALFYPPLSTFTPPVPPPPALYPPTSGQFSYAMLPASSGYVTQQAKPRPAPQSRCLKTIKTVQTQNSVSVKLSAAKEIPTVISIQTQKEPNNEGETKSQKVPMMEDDIKAKQKKRLEQFNQRMRLKKEQQMEAQRTRGLNQKSAPEHPPCSPLFSSCNVETRNLVCVGKVVRTEVKNVWICGHSLVFWAEKRATSPEIGMQLGMDPNTVRIWWKGVQGMIWQQLLPQLLQLKDNWPKPDVILIHLGGNDLGKMTPETFVLAVKNDLVSLKSIFPECHLVWSDILPRKSWRHSNDSTAVNNMRQAINKTIRGIMAELGGSSLTHDNIMPKVDSGLYRPDGVHLSGKGIDTFNLNMQDFLEKWESEISEAETSES
ncbi:uncharacterized protein si:dkeyp-121d4.3 isoform X3 [Tachysurus fulvidraco]|uniref:uncharacterized protein si:dkeyp-121d4.3 isoform X2 n=1 Tax=Tachysurus fulvidraco TaxID=1234273 RepID=UPI001FEF9A1F|nr:uncharacterized protein si:dkeyp-121d4.3 isoform X2 [Tachysurus fulvidraco]XP_047668406.1 uncharacterized protein si:dkeyp-121d4.3 isoform X3 [Tachysurus fulvidraco]